MKFRIGALLALSLIVGCEDSGKPADPLDGLDAVSDDGDGPRATYFAPPDPGVAPYALQPLLLDTPWTDQVSEERPWPEYPRPQMVRDRWMNLNGQWQFAPTADLSEPPFGVRLAETILVPFPILSPLSGIARNEKRAWYRRTFEVPAEWETERILLRFGAVTHEARVWVNGQRVGEHVGSYDVFSFDITDALTPGANELIVGVIDPQQGDLEPVGKQSPFSLMVFFSPSSGIWRTVWLEPAPESNIERLEQTPDLDAEALRVKVRVNDLRGDERVKLTARAGEILIGQATGQPGEEIVLPVPHPQLWSPESPFLYDLDVELLRDGERVDFVDSYFGMRSSALVSLEGIPRMGLNGEFRFQIGPLDQGYWPDGIYTAPTEEALRFDLEATLDLGFNMTRKHVKVESQRWYYWADRLGLLVWQDMPNMPVLGSQSLTDAQKGQFELELAEMIDELRSHPSILVWIPFNEGWGEFDGERITQWVKDRDPSRLVIGNSGSANCCATPEPPNGDIRDSHLYNGPWSPQPDHRAAVTGEFGGACFGGTEGHVWEGSMLPNGVGEGLASPPARQGMLRRLWAALKEDMRDPGMSAAVYTEITDVQQEYGGLMTYDRRIHKCDKDLIRDLNTELIEASRDPERRRKRGGGLPEGQLAYWPLDEGQGGAAPENGSDGPTLTLHDGAGWGSGVRGGALRLDGGTQRAVSDAPVLDIQKSFTVSAWLSHGDRAQSEAAISQGGESGFSLGLLNMDGRSDLLLSTTRYGPNSDTPYPPWRWSFFVSQRHVNSSYGDGPMMPESGQWDHVVGIMDYEARVISIFLNGRSVDHWIMESKPAESGPLTIGDGFNGAVDELRVWNRAISAAEAVELYAYESERVD